jgi:hypothetical protein
MKNVSQNSGGERLDQGLSFSLHHEIAVRVMPAEAGIQGWRGAERGVMDSRFRGDDEKKFPRFFIEPLRRDTKDTIGSRPTPSRGQAFRGNEDESVLERHCFVSTLRRVSKRKSAKRRRDDV